LFAFTVVPIALLISLGIAWVIFEKVKHKSFFETIFFMPYVTSTIAIGIVFRYFFNGSYGMINYLLGLVGIPAVNWLDSVQMSMPTLIIFGIWSSLAFNIIILLSGLRNIDEEHYKIARMFGATNWEIFRRITLGIPAVNWLDSVQMSMPTLIIFGIWSSLAFNIIILLSGLRNIDEEHYKIARMFGATNWEIFRRITLPQLLPTIAFLITVNLISSFKVYTEVYALFGGKAGIANSATTAVYYIYDKFHVAGRPGVAMAATVILFIVILIVTFLQNKLLKKVGE